MATMGEVGTGQGGQGVDGLVLTLATVSFPERALAGLEGAGETPRSRAKAALIHGWGEGALRPWDLAAHGGGLLVVNGWAADPARLAPTEWSRRLGAVVELRTWTVPSTGGTALMRLTAVAQRDLGNGHGTTRRTMTDAAGPLEPGEPHDSERRRRAYSAWLGEALARPAHGDPSGRPRSGMRMASAPEVLRAGRVTARGRKAGGDKRRDVTLPAVSAVLDVEVVDPAALAAFLLSGFRKAKDLGLGCLLPYGLALPGMAR